VPDFLVILSLIPELVVAATGVAAAAEYHSRYDLRFSVLAQSVYTYAFLRLPIPFFSLLWLLQRRRTPRAVPRLALLAAALLSSQQGEMTGLVE
jgi:hypothetical protein